MEQLTMLNLMQNMGEHMLQAGTKNSDPEGFQKLMEQSQGSGETSEAGKPADTQTAADASEKPDAPETKDVANGETKPVQDDAELEKQMVLAAMAMLQNPVVPVEQVMTPEAPVVEAAAVVETVEILPVEAEAAAVEIPLDVEPEAVEMTVETPMETPEAPEKADAPAVEADVEPVKAPEAAEKSEEPKDLEVEVKTGDESKPETEETVEVQEDMAERPVFENVREVPVKVGEAPAAEEPAEPVEVQVRDQLTQALANGETKVEIQLTPENLGKIRVEMTLSEDGGLVVQLHAENSRTQSLLSKNLSGLEALLARNSEQDVHVEVPRQEESQKQQNLFDQEEQRRQRQQQQRQEQPHNSEDFLQQLRLGLIPVDEEEI